MFRVRVALNAFAFASDALSRAVALLAFLCVPVDLHKHGVVDVISEGALDGAEVAFQTIAGKLHAIYKTASQIFHEVTSGCRISLPDHEARHQLGICVN